jgi:pilus assembly protein Flp/PilA
LISRTAQGQANVKQKEQVMSKFNSIVARFLRDEEGASLIEYSILIGLITALVIAIIVVVGQWVATAWSDLNAQLT